jgi:hypothetical protein
MSDPVASASSMPKTLHEARGIIASLRKQLGHSLPAGTKPIPPIPVDDGKVKPNPDRSLPPPVELSDMAPAALASFLSRCGAAEVRILLSRECSKNGKVKNDRLVKELYAELRKRGLTYAK